MVQRQRREPQVSESTSALDDRGNALSALLPEVLKRFEVDIGAALDEVTVTARPKDVPAVCRTAKEDPSLDFDYLRCLSVG